MRAATKKPLTGAEIFDKLDVNHPGEHGNDARGIGRPLGQLVKEGLLVKEGSTRPKYRKP